MIDPRRQFGPYGSTAETADSAVGQRASDHQPARAEDSEEYLSYDKRAAAAVEAVRQVEAYLSGKSTRPGTRRAGRDSK